MPDPQNPGGRRPLTDEDMYRLLGGLGPEEEAVEPEPQPTERTMRPGLLPHAGALVTRLASGLTSGIVGAVPSFVTTPAAAAIGGAGEALAQYMESPDDIDKSTVALEAGLSAVPLGFIFREAKAGVPIARQVVANMARGAVLNEAGNVARRYNASGNLLPQSKGEVIGDLATSALGAGFGALGAKPTRARIMEEGGISADTLPIPDNAEAKLMEAITAGHEPADTELPANLVSLTKGRKTGRALEQPTAPYVRPRVPVRVEPVRTLTAEEVAAKNQGLGAYEATPENTPTMPGVLNEQQAAARRNPNIHPDLLDADRVARKPAAVAQSMDKAAENAQRMADVQRKANRESIRTEQQKAKLEEKADLEYNKNQTREAEKAAAAPQKELEKAQGEAYREKALREREQAKFEAKQKEERAGDFIASRAGELIPGKPVVTESVTENTPQGKRTYKQSFYEPEEGGVDAEGIEPPAGMPPKKPTPRGEKPVIPAQKPEVVEATTYSTKEKANQAIIASGKRGEPRSAGRGKWQIVWAEEGKPPAAPAPAPVTPLPEQKAGPNNPPEAPPAAAPVKPAPKPPAPPAPAAVEAKAEPAQTPAVKAEQPAPKPAAKPTEGNPDLGGKFVVVGQTKDGKIQIYIGASKDHLIQEYNGLKNSGGHYIRIGTAKLPKGMTQAEMVEKVARQYNGKPEGVTLYDRTQPAVGQKLGTAAPKTEVAKAEVKVETPKPATPAPAKPKVSSDMLEMSKAKDANGNEVWKLSNKSTGEIYFASKDKVAVWNKGDELTGGGPRTWVRGAEVPPKGAPKGTLDEKLAGDQKYQEAKAKFHSEANKLKAETLKKAEEAKANLKKPSVPVKGEAPAPAEKPAVEAAKPVPAPKAEAPTAQPKAEPKVTDADLAEELKNWTNDELNAGRKHPNLIPAINEETQRRLRLKESETKGFEGPDRGATTPAEPKAEPVAEDGAEPYRKTAIEYVSRYQKDDLPRMKANLEKKGWSNVREVASKNGDHYTLEGTPPQANPGKLEKSTKVDLTGVKDTKDVKTRVVQALKNELDATEHTTNVEAKGGDIYVDGEHVATVSKARHGSKEVSLNFREEIRNAAENHELPKFTDADATKAEATQAAIQMVRGWWLKRTGAPMVEITLPDGFSIKVPKDKTVIQDAIRAIEKGDESAWQSYVGKEPRPTGKEIPNERPWDKGRQPTLEQLQSQAYRDQSEAIDKVRELVHDFKTNPDNAKPATIKLESGFEMTIEPHQAEAALEKLEKAPLNVWETAAQSKPEVTITRDYGSSFGAKGDSHAPSYKLDLPKLKGSKPIVPVKGRPTTSPTVEGAVENVKGAAKQASEVVSAEKDRAVGLKKSADEYLKTRTPEEVEASKARVAAAQEKVARGKAAAEKKAAEPQAGSVPTTKDGQTKAQLLEKHGIDPKSDANDLALEQQKAADDYFALKEQAQKDPSLQPQVRAAGQKLGELKAAAALAAKEEGSQVKPVVEPVSTKTKGKGPDSDQIAQMKPEEQDKAIHEGVEDFLSKKLKKRGKTVTLGAGFGSLQELYESNPALFMKLGLSTAGAIAGAKSTPDHPVLGAMMGATAGFYAPSVMRAVQRSILKMPEAAAEAPKKAFTDALYDKLQTAAKVYPDLFRASLLSHPVNLAFNAWAGPYGSAIMGSLEKALAGDKRAVGALRELVKLKPFGKEWYSHLQAAKEAVRAAGGRAEYEGALRGKVADYAAIPADAMTAGDMAARVILMRHGFTEAEAKMLTLTSEPMSAWAKGIGNMRKTKGFSGQPSFLLSMTLPFYRTNANQIEQSLLRTPIAPLLRRSMGLPPETLRQLAVKNGMSVAIGAIAYNVGSRTDNPQDQRYWLKFLNNFAGPYGITASAAFIAGTISKKHDDPVETMQAAAIKMFKDGMPLPNSDFFVKLAQGVGTVLKKDEKGNRFSEMPDLPYGAVPPFLSSKEQMSIPTGMRYLAGDKNADQPTKKEYSIGAPFVKDLTGHNPRLRARPKTPIAQRIQDQKSKLAKYRKAQRDRVKEMQGDDY